MTALTLTSANQIKLNSGACIDSTVSDLELGIRALVGYHNYFRIGTAEASALVQARADAAGLNWRAGCATMCGNKIPDGAIQVGQVTVHHGDRGFALYVVKRDA